MALIESAEQRALRDVMQSFTSKHATEADVRKVMDSDDDYDRTAWSMLAEQIGGPALAIPEEFGGAGFGFEELAIVLECAGASLYPSPLMSSAVLATSALLLSRDEEMCHRLLPGLAAGTSTATVAFADTGLGLGVDGLTTRAVHSDTGWALTGTKQYVLDATSADFLVIAALADEGPSLFVVDAGAPGLVVEPVAAMDLTRSFATVHLDQCPAAPVGVLGGAAELTAELLDRALVALAAEQVGAAAEVLDRIVEYLKVRHQFGRPIGSFQALKHRCADLLVEVESARSAVAYATQAVASDGDDRSIAASIAKVYCSETLYHCAAESIQMHGGIGFTWEHHAHLYFKRAKVSEMLFGSPAMHRERIGRLIGLSQEVAE